MKKYSISLSDKIQQSSTKVFELCKNDKNEFDNFFNIIEKEGTHFGYLSAALRILQDTSNNTNLRGSNKIRLLDTIGNCKLYEVKKDILRIYFFKDENGRIIVTGGKKNDQDKDISRVKKIIKDYLNEQ
ncbi:hypothetical protein SAMN05421847_2568 [Halpernia humi]|uniref:Addiction module toxin RelE n=1 Tax=Halpernia humi TaxID=493375 RepID=A0A1H6AQP1_9FLAO|nr:hypothetical protein SAMN05421847_2568 [Halpernia humi]